MRALRHAFSTLRTRECFLRVCRQRSDWKLHARAHEDLKRDEHISLYIDPMILNTRHRGRQGILAFEHKIVVSVCPVCRPHARHRPAAPCSLVLEPLAAASRTDVYPAALPGRSAEASAVRRTVCLRIVHLRRHEGCASRMLFTSGPVGGFFVAERELFLGQQRSVCEKV